MKRAAATLTALALGVTVCALRTLLAPIRWAERLTEDPADEDEGYVWWRDDEDRDGDASTWAMLGVDPNVEVPQNGTRSRQEQNR